MDKMKMESENIQQENVAKIAALFPNCVTETRNENGHLKKVINFELLKQMLSDSVIDGDEAYEFTWVGKNASIVEANRPIRKTLRPVKEDSVNWDTTENLYIEGDNLEVLKLLQESYLGKVKMIYIDPPYNTGNEGWVYNDNVNDPRMRDWLHKTVGKEGEDLSRHDKWLCMMYPRLKLLQKMLHPTEGSIFISIDENEVHNLKLICHEIFGASHHVATIAWKKRYSRENRGAIGDAHEYILVYASDVETFKEIRHKVEFDENSAH